MKARLPRLATLAFSAILVGLGVTLIVETALVGGRLGYLLGTIFALVGGARLYLSFR